MANARFIKHESIHLLDTVRVGGRYLDVDITRVGVVTKRRHEGRAYVYESREGVELLRVHGDGTTEPARARITLVNRVANAEAFQVDPEPSLFEMEDV